MKSHTYNSPVGELTLVASDDGLVAILWPDDGRLDYPDAQPGSNASLDVTVKQLDEYFSGERSEFELQLDLRGTDFQVNVWKSLANIPFGGTVSYAEQAERLGKPSAVRAVAAANGRNPISIVLPCHRVVGSNGKLTGYAGGLDAKRWLLEHESDQAQLTLA